MPATRNRERRQLSRGEAFLAVYAGAFKPSLIRRRQPGVGTPRGVEGLIRADQMLSVIAKTVVGESGEPCRSQSCNRSRTAATSPAGIRFAPQLRMV